MNDEWISKLKIIHQKKGWIPGQPVETEDILQAFKDAGMTEEEQAELLAGFMAAVDVKPADVAPTILTLAQIIDMVRDPSRMEELKAALAAMPADKKQELVAQVKALTPSDAPKPAPEKNELDKQLDTVLGQMRKLQVSAQGKPIPAELVTTLNADITKAQFNKDYAVRSAKQILTLHKQGYQVKDVYTNWMRYNAKGRKEKSIQEDQIV